MTQAITRFEEERERLRVYLREWAMWQEQYQPHLGYPRGCVFANARERGAVTASEYMERSDKWAMQVIDSSIEDLGRRPDGAALRAALRNRLLNEAVGARVFRHQRLAEMSTEEIDALADRAEREMVLIVKAKGLPL